MKAFEFKPKLFTTLQNYSKEKLHGRPHGRNYRRYCCTSTGYRIWYRFGSFPRKRHHHCYCSRIYHLFIRRKQSTDRRTYRSIYRNYLWNHPRIRHQRINSSNSYGRSTPYFIRCIQAGSCYQIHSLSHYCRIYQWYCRYHLYDTDCRYLRTELRRRKSTGRLHR